MAEESAETVLEQARACRETADRAEAELLALAVTWAHLHPAESIHNAARLEESIVGDDQPLLIAGSGTPLVSEFCIAAFAAHINLPTRAGKELIGEALELAHRLPRTWSRVQSVELPAWRGRRIARSTMNLSKEAAEFVDKRIAPTAHKVGPNVTERLVDEARVRFEPDEVEAERARALDGRHATMRHNRTSVGGTSFLVAELDLTDALDLDAALVAGARSLAEGGMTAALDVRRSIALGMLARGEGPFAPAGSATTAGRKVVLHVHTTADQLSGDSENPLVTVQSSAGTHLLTPKAVREWCGAPNTTRVTVRPILDLAEQIHTDRYEIPDRLDEQVAERDVTCVFPHCHRKATACDTDHIIAWQRGGETSTANLAALCRFHHRLKTHTDWTYVAEKPRRYRWTSPQGHNYVRDHTGTTTMPAGP